VIFGYTEEQLAHFFLTWGVGAFILFMVFIILQLARQSKAGKFGTFVIFLGLGVGFVGYLAKIIIQWWIESQLIHGAALTGSLLEQGPPRSENLPLPKEGEEAVPQWINPVSPVRA
jgi:hypothetical protein